jgi:hypothetical protein
MAKIFWIAVSVNAALSLVLLRMGLTATARAKWA